MKKVFTKKKILSAILASIVYAAIPNTASAVYCSSWGTSNPANPNLTGGWQPQPIRDSATGCTGVKIVDEFTGGAASMIDKIKEDIIQSGREVQKQMEANSAAEVATISNATESLIKTMAAINDAQTRDFINMTRLMLDIEMNYMSELKEREIRALTSPVSLNDTQEVYQYILHNIDEEIKSGKAHSQPLIAEMSKQDRTTNGTIIPVQIKAGESPYSQTGESCKGYDPAVDKTPNECFYGVRDFPSEKMSKLFNECSREKRRTLASVKKAATSSTISREVGRSQDDFMKITNNLRGSAISNRIKQQADISCSISDLKSKFCHPNLSEKEFVEKVIKLEIIPNGSISSSNFLSPTPVGSVDGRYNLEMEEADLKAMNITSLDRESENASGNSNAVSSNTVPIVNTYRTSSQYVAAKDFVANILAKELVPNQDPASRKSTAGAMYQTRFLSRAAAMSLAEVSMNKSIEARVGKKLREEIDKGTNFNPEVTNANGKGKVIIEDINGAGYLDELADSIHKDYQKIVVNSENGNSGIEEISLMSPEAVKEWQLSTIIRQNELSLIQYEQNERIELLLAAMLAQLTNSASEIKYIEDARRQ